MKQAHIIGDIESLSHEEAHQLLDGLEKALKLSHNSEGAGEHPDPIQRKVEHSIMQTISFRDLLSGLEQFLYLNSIEKSARKDGIVYKPDGTPFTMQELEALDWFIEQFFQVYRGTERALAIRAFLIGKMTAEAQQTGQSIRISYQSLPKDYLELKRKFKLTESDVRAIKWGEIHLAEDITNIRDDSRKKVKQIVIEAAKNRQTSAQLRQELFDSMIGDEADLNRDWRRIAISETTRLCNEGRISTVPDFEYLIGFSYPDACRFCLENIHHKIFVKLPQAPPGYSHLDPSGERYKAISLLWEGCVWSGKTNMGRSEAKRKRVVQDDGRTILVPREHYELAFAALLTHPHCRCTYVRFYPDLQFINAKGEIDVRSERTETEFAVWRRIFMQQNEKIMEAAREVRMT